MVLPLEESNRPTLRAPRAEASSSSYLCEKCPLRLYRLCRTLRSEKLSGTNPVRLRRYKRDTAIYEAGEVPGLLGVLRTGYLRNERIYGNGRRTIFGLSRPGEIVGSMPGQMAQTSVEAATDVEICCFEDDAVIELVKGNKRFRLELLFQAAIRRDLQFELIWQRGALNSRERVFGFLVMMVGFLPTEPLPDGSVIVSIDLSRRDWADMTSTTVETISRTMTALSKMGLVESVARNRYRISDLRRLANMAGMNAPIKFTARPQFPS